MSSTTVTVSLALQSIASIRNKTTTTWWAQRKTDEITTTRLVNRLDEIIMSGQTGSVDDANGLLLGSMYTTCGLA